MTLAVVPVKSSCVSGLVVEAHGGESQNVRRLSWAGMDHMVSVERGVKPSAIRCLLSAVCDRKHLHAALCSTGRGTVTVARKLHRWLCVCCVELPLKNGAVEPSRSSQGHGSGFVDVGGECSQLSVV